MKDNKIGFKKADKMESTEVETALNTLKKKKEEKGILPKTSDKKIVIINGEKNFNGKSLKIEKRLFKNGQNYAYRAGTSWEDIDAFGKKNLHFTESDFI